MSIARPAKTPDDGEAQGRDLSMPVADTIEAGPNLKRSCRRVITAEISGSLAKLGAGGAGAATWKIDSQAIEHVFSPKTSEVNGNRDQTSDLKNVVLHGVELLGVQSTFPVTLGLKISGVEGKHYTQTGEQFSHIVMAGQNWSGHEYLTKPEEALVNSDYLQKYPGMTVDNLRTKHVVRVPDEQFVFVDANHPVVEMLDANSDVLQINIQEAELIDGRWYKVNSDVFEDCARLLDKELLQNLPIMDLTEFTVEAQRTGHSAWASPAQACSNAGSSAKASEMILTRENTISVQFAIEYGFM